MIAASLLIAAMVAQDTLPPAARRMLADVRYLSDDARQGRGVGTAGIDEAARYIADAFARAGVAPAGPDRSYFQPFTIPPDAPAILHTTLGGVKTQNVVAVLAGSSPALRGQVVVIGAHYDHLGYGGFGALDPDSTGKVHDGADDNASGVAALLEVARLLHARRPARTIVFIAFSGEEIGDIGSTHFVKHPLVEPVDSIYAMLNMDMVGRLRNDRLLAMGAATAQEFPALLDSLNGKDGARFDLHASGDGWGPSDHASFFAAKRPVLQFFTDLHEDYHRTTDRWEKINSIGLVRVAAFVADVTWTLANRAALLTFVDAAAPQMATGGAGYGAYLGTIPDMTGSPGGVRLVGVRAGSPAERAGLKAGDVITGMGAKAIANLIEMTEALRSHQPGDTVTIAVTRDGAAIQLNAVLGEAKLLTLKSDAAALVRALRAAHLHDAPRLQLLQLACQRVCTWGAPFTSVYAYMLHGSELVLEAFAGRATEHVRIPVGMGVCGTAIATGQDQVVPDVTAIGNHLACNTDTRSELVVLIKRGAAILGQLDVDSDVAAGFTPAHHSAVKRVADALAVLL